MDVFSFHKWMFFRSYQRIMREYKKQTQILIVIFLVDFRSELLRSVFSPRSHCHFSSFTSLANEDLRDRNAQIISPRRCESPHQHDCCWFLRAGSSRTADAVRGRQQDSEQPSSSIMNGHAPTPDAGEAEESADSKNNPNKHRLVCLSHNIAVSELDRLTRISRWTQTTRRLGLKLAVCILMACGLVLLYARTRCRLHMQTASPLPPYLLEGVRVSAV